MSPGTEYGCLDIFCFASFEFSIFMGKFPDPLGRL